MKNSQTQLQQFYRQVFESPAGKAVFEDLNRVIHQTRVTSDSPNPYAAVYQVAQQQLLRRIENMGRERNVQNNNNKEHII